MDRFSTNRKRPAPTYNDSSASKRSQQSKASNSHDSLFLSDDEGDAQIDEELFGCDNDNGFTSLINTLRPQPVQPTQSLPAQPRLTYERPATSSTAQPRTGSYFTVTPTTQGVRNTTNDTSSAAKNSNPTNARSTPANNDLVEVKDETDEAVKPDWVRDIADKDKVKLFIGKRNKQILVKRADLAKSPTLSSWVIDDPDQGAYIMRPQLAKTEFIDFDAVLQFLHSSEYAPILVDNGLDGLKTDEAYAKELVRSGRIYIIAQTFQVEGLAELVLDKISKVDVDKFPTKAIVELAGVIFNDKRFAPLANPAVAAAVGSANGGEGVPDSEAAAGAKDKLEEWIITHVAKNFREIMNIQQEAFWKVERATSKKMFFAQVMEETAQQYRATGGRLPEPVVQLD